MPRPPHGGQGGGVPLRPEAGGHLGLSGLGADDGAALVSPLKAGHRRVVMLIEGLLQTVEGPEDDSEVSSITVNLLHSVLRALHETYPMSL